MAGFSATDFVSVGNDASIRWTIRSAVGHAPFVTKPAYGLAMATARSDVGFKRGPDGRRIKNPEREMAKTQKQDGEQKAAEAKTKSKPTANAVQKYLEKIEKLDKLKAEGGAKAASEVEAIIVGLVTLFNAGQSLQKMYDGALEHEVVSVPIGAFNKAVVAAFGKRDGVDKDRLKSLGERIAKNQASGLKIKSGTETVPKGLHDALSESFTKVADERDALALERDQLAESNRQLESELATFGEIRDKGTTKTIGRLKNDIALLKEALNKHGVPIPEGVGAQPPNASAVLSGGDQDSGLRTPMGAVPQSEAKD